MIEIIKEALQFSNKGRMVFLALVLSGLIVLEIFATVMIPQWREYFFDGVEAKSYDVFITGLWYFAALMSTFAITQGFKQYSVQILALEWRKALNNMLIKRWRASGMCNVDNPDQRIAEDTKIASELALELVVEVAISTSIIVGLVGSMSGMLLAISFGYTAVITVIALFFHRPMIDREKQTQRAEADYRFKLAKCVADGKKRKLSPKFDIVCEKVVKLFRITLGFNLFSRAKGNLMNILPYGLLIPMYFAGDIGFGEVMKGVSQFDLLVINATILIILYPRVTKALASYERIKEFYMDLKGGVK